jgi:anti-anti-sigma factor
MGIKLTCPNGHVLKVKDQYAGQAGFCPHCRARIHIPELKKVSEDEIAAILGPGQVAPPPEPAEEFVDPQPRQEAEESGVNVLNSALLRRKKVCPQCCEITSLSFRLCPRCGTLLFACTVPTSDEEHAQAAKSVCRYVGVRKQGDVTILRFGEHRILDQSVVDKIGGELYQVADRPDCRNLLLNFANVVGLSSLMLGTMLMLKRKMDAKGGQFKLCHVGAEIGEVFATTKLGQMFDIQDNERDALKAFELPWTGA